MKTTYKSLFRKLAAALAAITAAIGLTFSAQAVSTTVVIYELYGAGGNSGSQLNSDYAVLFNLSSTPQSINGWSLQYASATGTSWTSVALPNSTIPANSFFCVKFSNPTNTTGSAFQSDFTNTAINMAAAGGKLALMKVTTALTVANPVGNANLVDLVGSAGANGFEGATAPAMNGTTQILQRNNACTDTDNNTNDFKLVTITTAYQPAYSAFPTHSCSSPNPPTIFNVTPLSQTNNAGTSASFLVQMSGGDAPFTNYWYFGSVSPGNLVGTTTNSTFTLNNIGGNNAGSYIVVVSNLTATSATGSPVTLVVNDPAINLEPANEQGLLGQSTQFTVGAGGNPLAYQWYYCDTNGNNLIPVANGVNTFSTSVNSGATNATLTITGLTASDPTNFIVIVSNTASTLTKTSTVASLVSVTLTADLAFWNFNGNQFSNNPASPPTYYGIGSAIGANGTGLSGSADPDDGAGLPGFGLGGPPYISWSLQAFPPQGTSNKTAGLQYMASTVGANKIGISYEARETGTASCYNRLQFTTNAGTTWVDFPSSSTFGNPTNIASVPLTNALGEAGYTVSGWAAPNPFTYDLTGYPGVDNNPAFGFRVVSEWQSTGTYGLSPNTNYYGVANAYGTGGTFTMDLVTLTGSSITNISAAPTIGSITNTNVNDFQTVTVPVSVNDTANSPNSLVMSAKTVDVYNILGLSPGSFAFGGSGTARTLTITPVQDLDFIAPVVVTATDPATGLAASTWFYLTVLSVNAPPTNSLLAFTGTNTQYNASVSIPFTTGDSVTPAASLTYSATSGNNTVLPNANITFNTSSPGSPIAIIAPNTSPKTVGVAPVSVTVTDDGVVFNSVPHTDIRSTTATFPVEVLPNTNCVLIDYFNYDSTGALVTVSKGLWTHLSGNANQIQTGTVTPGFATINTLAQTENLQAKLIGAPYSTNSSAVLYASFIVNMDPNNMPNQDGGYFAVFNDGSGTTGNYSDRIMVATNGAAAGFYRIGVNNAGADAGTGVLVPMDLTPGVNYSIVTQVVLSNGWSTIWVNPSSSNSPSYTDTTPVATHFNISDFELRSNGGADGIVNVGKLKVGKTFDSVFPSLAITQAGGNVVLTSSDPTIGVQSATVVTGPYSAASASTPYTNAVGSTQTYYRLHQ